MVRLERFDSFVFTLCQLSLPRGDTSGRNTRLKAQAESTRLRNHPVRRQTQAPTRSMSCEVHR